MAPSSKFDVGASRRRACDRVSGRRSLLVIARVWCTVLGIWLIYDAIIGGEYRGALPGSSLKGERIPSWMGRLGFLAGGVWFLVLAWRG